MNVNEFTVNIPSNSSMQLFPDNKIGEFIAHFPTALELNNKYEVGLCSIHYTQSWNNIREGENSFDFSYTYRNGRKFAISHKIIPGYYPTVQSVLDTILSIYTTTHKKNAWVSGLKMEFNASTRKVRISTNEMVIKFKRTGGRGGETDSKTELRLNGDVARILGFEDAQLIVGKDIEGSFCASPNGGFHQLYIYTDLIQPQISPDGEYPLLRVIAVEDKPNQVNVEKSFSPVFYKQLKKHPIDTAQFWLMEDSGKRIDFQHGNVVIVLSFRKKL